MGFRFRVSVLRSSLRGLGRRDLEDGLLELIGEIPLFLILLFFIALEPRVE